MGLQTTTRPSFGGHETFPFRYTWLRKALEGIAQDEQLFTREDALVRLGVGKNMVRSIHHWSTACGILAPPADARRAKAGVLEATDFGRSLLSDGGWDPYLEDPGSLWLLHWQIASRPDHAATWYYVFNLFPEPRFTRAGLVERLVAMAKENQWPRVSPASLKRDVDTFVRSYVAPAITRERFFEEYLDCPLAELRLIGEVSSGEYEIRRADHSSLPDAVFAYAVAEFLSRRPGRVRTVAIENLQFDEGAPGRVFALDAQAIFVRVERLAELTDGALTFDNTAGLSQLLVHRELDPFAILTTYYRGPTA